MPVTLVLLQLLALTISAAAAALAPLRTNGTRLVTADTGVPVTLRGFNLGNWLVNEMWMMPIAAPIPPDHVAFWGQVQARFGADGRRRKWFCRLFCGRAAAAADRVARHVARRRGHGARTHGGAQRRTAAVHRR